MAYRNDVEALEARHHALEVEVADRVRARDEVATMLREAREGEAAERHFAARMSGSLRRRRQRRTLIGMALVLGALGVFAGSRVEARHTDHVASRARVAEAFARMQLWTGEICGCKTVDCVTNVSNEMTKWSITTSSRFDHNQPFPETDIKRMTDIGQHMAECMVRVYSEQQPQPAQQ